MPDYEPRLTAELYHRQGLTKLNDLEQHFDLTWQDLTNDTGTGEVKVPVSSPDAADIEEGTHVHCLVDGVHRFTWTVEDADKVFVSRGEEVEEVVHARGRGHGCMAERTVVYPYGGATAKPAVDDRVFNFGAADYDDSAWTTPADLGAQSSGPAPWTDTGSPAPLQWPDGAARWLWGDADNSQPVRTYFRSTFLLPSEKRVAIFATADDDFTLYLNGIPILAELDALWPFRLIYKKEQVLPAGTYTLAAVVENAGGGVGGFLCTVWTISSSGNLDVLLRRSDTTNWVALYDPADAPGLTPGAILSVLIDETVGLFTYDFDAVNDSNGDPWPIIADYSIPIGSSLLDVLNQLAAQGWLDYSFSVDGVPVLSAYNPEGAMTVTAVTYTDGVNIAELSHKQAEPITNRLLVKWPRGFVVVFDNLSIGTHGLREGFYTVDVEDIALVFELANRQLDRVKDGDPAIVLALEHAPDTNAEPYIDYALGDKVNAPNKAGVSTSYRVLGITVVQDAMGDPNYTLELNRRGSRPVLQLFDLLRALSGGSLGSLGGGTTPVNIPGGTGSTGGGSTGSGDNPGEPDPDDCDEHEDAAFSVDPYDSADVYIPNICLPDVIREQVSLEVLTWGPGFFGPLSEIGGNRAIEANSTGGLVLYGDLAAIDGVNGDVSIATNLVVLSTEPPGSSYQLVQQWGDKITVWIKDDGGTFTVKVEIIDAAGTASKAKPGLVYDQEHSVVATHADGGDFRLIVDGIYVSATSPMAAVDSGDGVWACYLPALASFGKAALWARELDPDEIGFILPPVPPPTPEMGVFHVGNGAIPSQTFTAEAEAGDLLVVMNSYRGIGASTPNDPTIGGVTISSWTTLHADASFDNFGVSDGTVNLKYAEVTSTGTLTVNASGVGRGGVAALVRGANSASPIIDTDASAIAGPATVTNVVGSALAGTHLGFIVASGSVDGGGVPRPAALTSFNHMTVVDSKAEALSAHVTQLYALRVLGGGSSFGISAELTTPNFDGGAGGWAAFSVAINYDT